jgi:hypothetical protein
MTTMDLTNIYKMADEELSEATALLASEIASIRYQMDRSVRPDVDWLAKANYALRMKEMQQARIHAEETRRRRVERLAVENRFITAAREMLDEQLFDEIMAVAQHNI